MEHAITLLNIFEESFLHLISWMSFPTRSKRFDKFDSFNTILFQIKPFGRKMKETSLTIHLVKIMLCIRCTWLSIKLYWWQNRPLVQQWSLRSNLKLNLSNLWSNLRSNQRSNLRSNQRSNLSLNLRSNLRPNRRSHLRSSLLWNRRSNLVNLL